ncbi:hypothetical protein B4113_2856 [Geobacillus sp. B4113_201601]|nr:hypothetical protein B4113_2856 [Geobacillus sp. B4113_201601]
MDGTRLFYLRNWHTHFHDRPFGKTVNNADPPEIDEVG